MDRPLMEEKKVVKSPSKSFMDFLGISSKKNEGQKVLT